ncbi:MAG: protein-glutamate O-methyltransferase CheR [Candidatus Omnitrophica bacterium]|nr:protein-glutamate O-methyltransferase CheR [Candidatus Omnitrophota bacterium]
MELIAKPVPLGEADYRALVKLIYEASGISLGDNKQELVKTRLGKRLRALGLDSYREYIRYLSEAGDDQELMLMINAISTNFTSFYRERQHFDFLLRTALPEIVRKKQAARSRKLRAWCAAASSGEEPYTLALTLLEFFDDPVAWDIKLLATDISTKVLSQAVRGLYPLERVKTVQPVLLERYFERLAGEEGVMFRVTDEVRRHIVFRRLNLMDRVFPFSGPFDFISCRNVMIYFDPPTQEAVVEKLLRYLAPGGYLLIGHSENLPAAFRTRVEVLAPATYRKPG